MTLSQSLLVGNGAPKVGGILNTGGASATIDQCTFRSNTTSNYDSSAILNQAGASLAVSNSTFITNSAGGSGGALVNAGGAATLSNCTFNGNQAYSGGGGGGAIYNFNPGSGGGSVTVSSCTFGGNKAGDNVVGGYGGGGAIYNNGATLTLQNSVFGGNVSLNAPDLLGAAGGDYNLLQDPSGATLSGTHNLTGLDPKLGALASNGGPTQTMALEAGSPALDAGDPATTEGNDQRGDSYPRVVNGRVDIGAYESQSQPPTAQAQSVTVARNGSVAITLTGTDPEADSLTFAIAAAPSHGTLSGTAPALTYAPAAGYFGADSFTFTVSDGFSTSAPATVSISVNETNAAPLASDDARETSQNVALSLASSALLSNDSPGAGESEQTLTLTGIGVPAHGTATLNSDGSILYTPETDYFGPDAFSYTIQDNGTTNGAPDPKMASATVNITVTRVNSAPAVTPIPNQTLNVGQPLDLTATATDSERDVITWSLETPGATTPDGPAIDAQTGVVSWTPTTAQIGTYGVVVRATDNGTPQRFDSATFTITVSVGVGSTDGGTSTGGNTTTGTTTSGTTTSGTTTSGNSTSGTTSSGTTSSGTTSSGTTSSGNSTSGSTTTGSTTTGTTTSGNTGGTTAGGTTTSGNSTSGTTTGGTTTGGTTTGGTTTGGTTTGGATTGGTTTGGNGSGRPPRRGHPGVGLRILREAVRLYFNR